MSLGSILQKKAGASAAADPGRPAWLPEDAEWTTQDQQLSRVYSEGLGREMTSTDYLHYRPLMDEGWGIGMVVADLATSDEARSAGIDPTQYGVKAVDPSDLDPEIRAYYDVWLKYNPDSVLYDFDVTRFGWAKDAGSADYYDQVLAGNITTSSQYQDGQIYEVTSISAPAASALGGDLSKHIYGTKAGVYYLFPESVDVNGKTTPVTLSGNFVDSQSQGDGSSLTVSTGNLDSGLLGDLGIDDPVSKVEGAIGQDALGFISGAYDIYTFGMWDVNKDILFGSKGGSRLDAAEGKFVDSTFGISSEDWELATEVGQRAAITAAEVATGGLAAPAIEAGYQASKAAQAGYTGQDFDYGQAAVSILFSAIGTPAWADTNVWTAVTWGALSAGTQTALSQGLNGEFDPEAIGESAFVGAVSGSSDYLNLPGANLAYGNLNLYSTVPRYLLADTDQSRKAIAMSAAIDAGFGVASGSGGGIEVKGNGTDPRVVPGGMFGPKWGTEGRASDYKRGSGWEGFRRPKAGGGKMSDSARIPAKLGWAVSENYLLAV